MLPLLLPRKSNLWREGKTAELGRLPSPREEEKARLENRQLKGQEEGAPIFAFCNKHPAPESEKERRGEKYLEPETGTSPRAVENSKRFPRFYTVLRHNTAPNKRQTQEQQRKGCACVSIKQQEGPPVFSPGRWAPKAEEKKEVL